MTDAAGPNPDQLEEIIAARVAQRTAEFQAHEQDLRNQNILFKAALTNMSQGLVMFDAQGRVVISNQRYLDMYSLTSSQVHAGSTIVEVLRHRLSSGSFAGDPEVYAREILGRIPGMRNSRRIVELPDGRTIAISNQPTPTGGWVATHEDITERRRAEEQIAHMARHDALTNLPNRARLREWLAHALSHAHRGRPLAVLHLDLDHFMTLNDSLGHPIGDELLRAVGDRLRDCVPDNDLVGRLGADEFAVVVTNIENANDCAAVATRISEAIRVPFEIAGHTILVDMSIGIAVAPDDGTEADALIKNADLALSRAKAEGRGLFRFFESGMDARMQSRRKLELALKTALPREEFELFYQPIINLATNQITSFEAVLRWHHPERGLILPSEFVFIAEEIGLISAIGEWVVNQACKEAASWPDELKVAVNLSPSHLVRPNIPSLISGALAAARLPPHRLEIEVTEAVLLQATEPALATLRKLREMGVRIALDDFGTGYSSLSYLRTFPFDKLKVDRAFIKDLGEDDQSFAIVEAIVMLAHALNVTTTAEGVETEAQLAHVRRLGFTEMQGFLISRPVPGAKPTPVRRAFAAG